MKKSRHPYESGQRMLSAMALYRFALDSDAVLYIGGMQGHLRELQHDFYLIDGQSTILMLPEHCPVDVTFELEWAEVI